VKKLAMLLLVCMVSMPALTQVTMAPSTSHFGDQPLDYYADTPFVVTNTGSEPITIGTITVGPNGPFSIYRSVTNDCTGLPQHQLAGNGHFCTLWVKFAPAAEGPASATLTVPYGSNEMLTASLAGNGIHDVTLVPTLLSVPYHITCDVYVGEINSNPGPCTVTLVNHEPDPLIVTRIEVMPSDYFWESDNCNNPVPPYGSCTITVQFNGPDGDLGTLQVVSNAKDSSPPTLNLQGSCRHYGC